MFIYCQMYSNKHIALIAAIGKGNRVIGFDDGRMPWDKISRDLQHFKETTMGCPIIMGRKTFESFGSRVLPGRPNIIITNQDDYPKQNNLFVTNSLAQALNKAVEKASEIDGDKIFIIGGGRVYAQTISIADSLHLTIIKGDFDGEVFFPEYEDIFEIESSEPAEENGQSFNFEIHKLRH